MAAKPELFNLVWRTNSPVDRKDSSKCEFKATTEHVNTLDVRPRRPGVILFPALLTPNLHVQGENKGMIELLVAAPKSPALSVDEVNYSLNVVRGLNSQMTTSHRPLFAKAEGKIVVKPVEPTSGRIFTDNVFRGILHKTVTNWLPKNLDAFYAVQIHESCLATAKDTGDDPDGLDLQDDAIENKVLLKRNGPALQQNRDQGGFGTHEFLYGDDRVDYSSVDLDRPIVAYHPLYVYPEGELQEIALGHVSDIHINARQRLLAKSPARVIDAESGTSESPAIGPLINVFESSFSSILDQLGTSADVLMIGGDLIEHIDNAFPYHGDFDPMELEKPSAADIWKWVDLDDHYDRNYQANVDFIAFYTRIRAFCSMARKPAFVVAGNHDCYGKNKIYGVSPRVARVKANAGIPADHNLTFYEAMLAFGENWWMAFGMLFDAKLYEWFHAVFTPFSDFSLELPKLRLVGLTWGEDEEVISGPDSWGQGGSHLGRAEEAITADQLALLQVRPDPSKKTGLMTHFTFVSYTEEIAIKEVRAPKDVPARGQVDVGELAVVRKGWPFSHNDSGTFEKLRAALYAEVANPALMAFVVTGHSHRKGLYFLGPLEGTSYTTEAHAMRISVGSADPSVHIRERTPIIVSDSGGPLPRLNLNHEFGEWGSDCPSGTLVQVSPAGRVTRLAVVAPLKVPQSKPRLAVAVDYAHCMKGFVFKEIKVNAFERAKATTALHRMTITFHKHFSDSIAEGMGVVLFGLSTLKGPWIRIKLEPGPFVHSERKDDKDRNKVTKLAERTFSVPRHDRRAFYDWLTLGSKAGRFMSFHFDSAGGLEHIYDTTSNWNLEVEAYPSWWNDFASGSQTYEIHPYVKPHGDGGHDRLGQPTDSVEYREAPNFWWRRQLPPYK